jgi:hypothetical protein
VRRLAFVALPLIVTLAGAGCSRSNSPMEPTGTGSPSPGPTATSGATIRGSVEGSGALTVQVVGTSISSPVNASRQFLLSSVPPGDRQLRFSGSGIDAQLAVSDIQVNETIELAVIVSGSSARLAAESQAALPVNGRISSFSGTPAAFQFQIGDRLIKGDAATEFFGNTVFADIANGREAEVKGLPRTGFVYAIRLHVNVPDESEEDDDEEQDQSASIEGVLSSKTGSSPNLTLIVAGTTVFTNGGTVIRRRGDVLDPSVLQTGMTVHVEGVRAGNGSITARMVQIKDDEVGGVFEISGSMGGVHGTCPALEFVVNGYKFWSDGGTTFEPACSTFKSGNKINVTGIRQGDGRIKATRVQKQ